MPFSTSLSSRLKVDLNWLFSNALDLATTKEADRERVESSLTDGTGDNQADEMWHDRRRLTPSTGTDDIDLAGSLTNVFGRTVTFVKVRRILIRNRGVPDGSGGFTVTAGEKIQVGGAGSAGNAWATMFNGDQDAKLTVHSGGLLCVDAPTDGYSVTAGSGDILRVALDGGGSNDVDYDVVVIGTTA